MGRGDCQLRNGAGQTRHLYLVLLAHRLLLAELGPGRVRAWANETLLTSGEACRAVRRETLGQTISWALERATLDGWEPARSMAQRKLA